MYEFVPAWPRLVWLEVAGVPVYGHATRAALLRGILNVVGRSARAGEYGVAH